MNGAVEADSHPPDLSIIIVSWNVAGLLVACLDSIYSTAANLAVDVIVVDSASSDGTVKHVQSDYPQATLLAQDSNIGFTRGNNIGLRVARGRHILLLNPDTEVRKGALGRMVAYLDENPDVGVVGPHTYNTDGSHQSTRRRFPTVPLAFFESTWLQGVAPRGWMDRFYVRDQSDDGTYDVDWVQGSALMLRRTVYEQIGGLDEGFVMFSEELDWCKRARNAGWRVVYIGDARIVHHGGKSTEQVSAKKHIYFQQSKLRYFRKHHGILVALTLRVFLLVSYAWQIGLEGVKSLLGSKRVMRQERMRLYWQVLRSGLKVH